MGKIQCQMEHRYKFKVPNAVKEIWENTVQHCKFLDKYKALFTCDFCSKLVCDKHAKILHEGMIKQKYACDDCITKALEYLNVPK